MKTHDSLFRWSLLACVVLLASTAPAATMPSPMITKPNDYPGFGLNAALDPANNLILSVSNGTVQSYSPSGAILWTAPALPGSTGGIAVDVDQ